MAGGVVLQLQSSFLDEQLEAYEDTGIDTSPEVRWYHVSLVYLSPWRLTFTEMTLSKLSTSD